MRVVVIGNPVSGRRRHSRRLPALVCLLEQRGHRVELLSTRAAGDAARLAAQLGQDVERLVVAGGDGTLNEVVNGLAEPGRIPIAQLPLGTANVLAHELRLPRQPAGVAQLIETGTPQTVRLAHANQRRFALLASAGFDADVVHRVATARNGHLGYLAYVRPIAAALAHHQPTGMRVQVDEHPPAAGALVIVANVRNYGGLFRVAHHVDCAGEALEVCVFEHGSLAALLAYGCAALCRRLHRSRSVTRLMGRRIRITADAPVPVQIDGDPAGHTPVAIERESEAITVLTPPRGR